MAAHQCLYVTKDDRGREHVCWICGQPMAPQPMSEDGRRMVGFTRALEHLILDAARVSGTPRSRNR